MASLLPAIRPNTASAKHEQSVSGVVTVGPESAARLTKQLGRKVEPGEQFDVGVLAYYHPKFFPRLWGSLKASRRHVFSQQR